METMEVVMTNPVIVTDMKKKMKDILMCVSWRDFANTYFQRSSSWFYHKWMVLMEMVVLAVSMLKKQNRCVVPSLIFLIASAGLRKIFRRGYH